MSGRAWAYIWAVLIAAASASILAVFSDLPDSSSQWVTFFILSALATLSQLFKVEAPNNQTYYATPVFLFSAVLLLQPSLFILVIVISYLVEWAKERLVKSPLLRQWYLQPFNIATHVLAGIGGAIVYNFIASNALPSTSLNSVTAIAMAALAYVTLNHVLVGVALVLARGVSLRDSGIFDTETLLTEMILLFMGSVVSVLWNLNPWLILPALSPLALIYKALMIPQLKKDAQTDGKTGLLNARYFSTLFTSEMERAKRFDRPMSLLMADLDLLRNINNTYGHLAGDAVLKRIGEIIRATIREYDIAGRFGGEEFAVVLPETGLHEARDVAERLREAVACADFVVSTSPTPIGVTMSIGIATFPGDATTPTDLMHASDIAVYRAKLNGRNCVVASTDIPHSVDLEGVPLPDRLETPYVAGETFIPRPLSVDEHENVELDGAYSQGAGQHTNGHHPNGRIQATSPAPVLAAVARSAASPAQIPAALVPVEKQPLAGQQRTATAQQQPSEKRRRISTEGILMVFVWTVIALGAVALVLGFMAESMESSARYMTTDLWAILLLVGLVIVSELFQVTLYGPDTVSVSAALMFTSALITGIPGIACVSLAIVIVHYVRRRPLLYRSAFNWSTHVLAGVPPVLAIYLVGLPLRVDTLLGLALPVAIASVVFFVIDTGLIAAAVGLSSGRNPLTTWREQYSWLFSHYMVLCVLGLFLGVAYIALGAIGVIVFALPVFMMRFSQKQYIERTEDSVRELRRMNEELTHANNEVMAASRAMKHLNEELFLTLSKIIDARDPYVGGHASKVADYALAIGKELGLPESRLEPLRQAGFLHDIGKIAISEAVLHKPGKLTDEEYEYIKTHAAIGGEFLEMCRGLRHLAPFVRHHHERWDGKGYPDTLGGEEIPLEARILAVCDSAEAMSSDRPYRKGMSLGEMIAEIKRCAGTQFDPDVARAFVMVVERERDRLIINSAHEVLKKQTDTGPTVPGSFPAKMPEAMPVLVMRQ